MFQNLSLPREPSPEPSALNQVLWVKCSGSSALEQTPNSWMQVVKRL